MSRNISYDESTEFTCLHDIQHRDYDESADNVDIDSDGSDQRKTFDVTDTQMDEAPPPAPAAPAAPATNPDESPLETSNSDTQALNLTTSTSTSSSSNVRNFGKSLIISEILKKDAKLIFHLFCFELIHRS